MRPRSIYVLEYADGVLKVGVSLDVHHRRQHIGARTGRGQPVREFKTEPLTDHFGNEEVIHRRLRQFALPGEKEWFAGIGFDAVVETAKGIIGRRAKHAW